MSDERDAALERIADALDSMAATMAAVLDLLSEREKKFAERAARPKFGDRDGGGRGGFGGRGKPRFGGDDDFGGGDEESGGRGFKKSFGAKKSFGDKPFGEKGARAPRGSNARDSFRSFDGPARGGSRGGAKAGGKPAGKGFKKKF